MRLKFNKLDKLLLESYHYQGTCPRTGRLLRLERTPAAEAAALALMRELPELAEGKMFGVLLTVEGPILRAFSGTQPQSGWAPPIYTPEPSPVPEQLDRLKHELQELARHPAFGQLAELQKTWQTRLADLQQQSRQAKERRDELRRQGLDSPELVLQSQREGTALRQLRAQKQADLEPLEREVAELSRQIMEVKHRRRELSANLQRQMHEQLSDCLSAGQPWSLASLFPAGPPTGTGECCAPKLLHQAACLGLTPTGMAEFWWGPPQGSRQPGHFYAACQERCQPLIGPLLGRFRPLEIIYQDQELLAVCKPPGVLTLPGRQSWNQDCLWLRLRNRFPDVLPIHRLDMETSGVCLWALTPECQRDLQRQFADRSVRKCYEALLSRQPAQTSGRLDLALGSDPNQPGSYRIDPNGKPSQTDFEQVDGVRYRFRPLTGRSHQIRVHAAQGLKTPICGDRLYGGGEGPLKLHARSLECLHQGRSLHLEADTPF
jgi:tRNA pseudouridine32 synthase/23S rRNA pseudouridine746 synthase